MSINKHIEIKNGQLWMSYKIEEYLNPIKEIYEEQQNMINALREENARLKSEHYKDSEIQKLVNRNEELSKDLYRGFSIKEDESVEIKNWKTEHEMTVHKRNRAAIGYTYCFTSTPIGTIGTIQCTCGAEFTFRDL